MNKFSNNIKKRNKCLLVFCFFLFLCLFFTPYKLQAQEKKVTLTVRNETPANVFEQLSKQTGLSFFYDQKVVNAASAISLNVQNASLQSVLDKITSQTNLNFNRVNNTITVGRRSKSKEAEQTQNKTIRGVVIDTNGEPIIGATVQVKGSTNGVITDLEGNYTLNNVQEDALIRISCIGYQTKELKTSSKELTRIIMIEDSELLDEVVVVGYGVQKKVNLTGAVATVSQEALKDRPVSNIGRALQGVIPNLNVTLSSGQPGAGASFNIRGTTSPNGGSPLVLVDGVESSLERINSNDVESITVLKDASSAAIYGARGAFGVILVTTKGGSYNEKPKISYSGSFSVSSPTTSTDFETRGYYSAKIADMFSLSSTGNPYTSYTDDEYQALWERRNDATEHPERPWVTTKMRNGKQQYVYLANFDWYNYLYDDSRPTWDHNINIKGGGKALSYMVSGRYYSQKGINRIEPDQFDSYNFRVKLQAEITPWLTITNNTKFFNSVYKYYGFESETDNFRKPTLHALASFVPVNPDGTAVSHTSMTHSASHYMMDGYNAMMQKGKSGGHKRTKEFATSFELNFKLHKNFDVKADFSYTSGYLRNDYRSVNVSYSQYPGEVLEEAEKYFPNKYKEVVWDQNYYVANAYGSYHNTFAEKHNVMLLAGYNYEAKYYRDLEVYNDGLLSEDLSDFNLAKGTNSGINGGRNEYAIMGWFYRATYNYKDRYLLEANGRYDGSSRFPRGNRFGFFPSFSLAYRVSEEAYFKPLRSFVDNLKLRFPMVH
ncbi:SusC/RagA family TonB-linked outer membrane protein [Dysgonomonas sp. 511]|uniref:SusC/RagA family TonB-linked outer membrane protein n=1 Tax=Dysgonomonas sp. 511 TaxID=2302930 RepID=UPI00210622B8|nr:SusC/RagA family TonB-linked outer membrane protein [Dysgonomonas sp. 511]